MSKEESSVKPVRKIKPILTREEEHRLDHGFYHELFWDTGDLKRREEESKREALQMLNQRLEWLRKKDGVRPGEEKE